MDDPDLKPDVVVSRNGALITGFMEGSLRVFGYWGLKADAFNETYSITGELKTEVTGMKIQNQVSTEKNDDGTMWFRNDGSLCKAEATSIKATVTSVYDPIDDRNKWLYEHPELLTKSNSTFIDLFEYKLKKMACFTTNFVIDEVLGNIYKATFSRKISLPLRSGGELTMDFKPDRITYLGGWSSCVFIASRTVIENSGGSKSMAEMVRSTFDPFRNPMKGGCGPMQQGSDINIKFFHGVPSAVTRGMHLSNQLQLYLENKGHVSNRLHFAVYPIMKAFEIDLTSHRARHIINLFHEKTISISSIGKPTVSIVRDGISVKLVVNAKVHLQKSCTIADCKSYTFREEYQAMVEWKVRLKLQKDNTQYTLVPEIIAKRALWEPQIQSSGGTRRYTLISDSMKELLNKVLEEITAQLEEDMEGGFTLNFPGEYFTIEHARVSYHVHYPSSITLSAKNIAIHL